MPSSAELKKLRAQLEDKDRKKTDYQSLLGLFEDGKLLRTFEKLSKQLFNSTSLKQEVKDLVNLNKNMEDKTAIYSLLKAEINKISRLDPLMYTSKAPIIAQAKYALAQDMNNTFEIEAAKIATKTNIELGEAEQIVRQTHANLLVQAAGEPYRDPQARLQVAMTNLADKQLTPISAAYFNQLLLDDRKYPRVLAARAKAIKYLDGQQKILENSPYHELKMNYGLLKNNLNALLSSAKQSHVRDSRRSDRLSPQTVIKFKTILEDKHNDYQTLKIKEAAYKILISKPQLYESYATLKQDVENFAKFKEKPKLGFFDKIKNFKTDVSEQIEQLTPRKPGK